MQNRVLCFTVPSAPSNPACSVPEVSVSAGSRPGPPQTSSWGPLSSHLPPWALRTLLQPGSPTFAVPGLILCHHTPGLWPPAQRAVAPCRPGRGRSTEFREPGFKSVTTQERNLDHREVLTPRQGHRHARGSTERAVGQGDPFGDSTPDL